MSLENEIDSRPSRYRASDGLPIRHMGHVPRASRPPPPKKKEEEEEKKRERKRKRKRITRKKKEGKTKTFP